MKLTLGGFEGAFQRHGQLPGRIAENKVHKVEVIDHPEKMNQKYLNIDVVRENKP